MSNKTCAERIDEHYDNTLETLRKLWAGYCHEDCPYCDGDGLKINPDACCEESPDYEIECEKCHGTGKLDEDVENFGNLNEYGLSFDYCYPTKRESGYFRYQLSWGGPSDEFRIYANQIKYGWKVYRIEYWFMDWFDGASKTLHGDDLKFMSQLIESYFGDTETMKYEFEKAMENYEPDFDEDDEDADEEDN